LPWQLLWPFRPRFYTDWFFWTVVAVIVVEFAIPTDVALLLSWGFGTVWLTVAFIRWWRTGSA